MSGGRRWCRRWRRRASGSGRPATGGTSISTARPCDQDLTPRRQGAKTSLCALASWREPVFKETHMPTVAAIIAFLEEFAPPSLAAEWDNVGLLLGDRQAPVERIMTCLTVTPESAAEAVEAQAQLIVTHHPILFRPVKRLTTANAEGRMLLALVRAGVAVYSPHTAFDN